MEVPTPDDIRKMDQNFMLIAESLPSLWWGLYSNCKDRGFTDTQALVIVLKYIEVSCRNN